MRYIASELPGLDRIRARFLSLLAERQTHIAHHVLGAWESDNAAERSEHLQEALTVIHQIAGTAGSLGFDALGRNALACEGTIITYLEGAASADDPSLPHSLIMELDGFVSQSQSLLLDNA